MTGAPAAPILAQKRGRSAGFQDAHTTLSGLTWEKGTLTGLMATASSQTQAPTPNRAPLTPGPYLAAFVLQNSATSGDTSRARVSLHRRATSSSAYAAMDAVGGRISP